MRKMTKGEMTKERILASAKELFYEQGYDATTIQQIADRSGTTRLYDLPFCDKGHLCEPSV